MIAAAEMSVMGNSLLATSSAREMPSLIMKPGREFAADSYVHRPLAPNAPKDPRSDLWVRSLLRQIRDFYGVVAVNFNMYSSPVFVVGPNQPTVKVKAARADDPGWSFEALQRQWLNVPLPDTFRPSKGTDKEALVYQPSTGGYWEFWDLEKTGSQVVDSAGRSVTEWRSAWGGRIDALGSNPGYFPTTPEGYKFGAAATGLALLGGLITIAEQRRGVIDHALHIALPQTRRGVWAWPAQRTDGENADPAAIPEGTTFRLPYNLDLDRIDMEPYARMLARAAQKHGLVVRDTAGAVALYAENPLTRGASNPYTGLHGILDCPAGRSVPNCYADSNNRLRGFPWDKLEATKAVMQQ